MIGSAKARFVAAALAAAVAACAGCASRPINERIDKVDPAGGYRATARLATRTNNDPHTLLVVAFSGGGTRAAAFAYGVLEELRRTEITVDGKRRRVLDEIDIVTGVSGGSFTALAYALYGGRLFDDYERNFLKRDVQGDLVGRVLNPLNWPRLVGGSYGRSELAADYYDEILFKGATFGDLLAQPGPMAFVTGTDLSTGSRLAFSQTDFDLLCSDVTKVRLARAAAASSAVPIVLSPVTLDNYGGTCGYEHPPWVSDVINPEARSRPAGRALMRLREMDDFQRGAARRYIHLVDGGISDNLGIRAILETLEELEASPTYRRTFTPARLDRIAVIVVNARSAPSTDWDQTETPPGFLIQLLQSTSVPIDRYSYESVELMRDTVARWELLRELLVARRRVAGATEDEAEARTRRITSFAIDVSFDAIADPAERDYFMNLPTTFALPPETVDRLREVAGRLVRESPEFQALLVDFRAP